MINTPAVVTVVVKAGWRRKTFKYYGATLTEAREAALQALSGCGSRQMTPKQVRSKGRRETWHIDAGGAK